MSRLRSIQIESFDDLDDTEAAPRKGRRSEDLLEQEPRQRVERERGWPERDGSDRRSRRERSAKREPIGG